MQKSQNTGNLYIVATPIGNLKDITLRALEILKTVDLIAAEDTRQSKKLLDHYGIETKTISLHNYNENEQSEILLEKLKTGKNIALISDAGTPLISDPGYRLVEISQNANIKVIPIPGACAFVSALSAGGLPTDSFIFVGFLPAKSKQRELKLKELSEETRTMIFYESPHRALDSLESMLKIFGEEREVVYARELTKIFETIKKTTLKELSEFVKNDPNQQKGEIVILVSGIKKSTDQDFIDSEAKRVLEILLQELSASKAVELGGIILKNTIPKKELYQLALSLKNQP